MLRNCTESRNFLNSWLSVFYAFKSFDGGIEHWLHDQGSLQNVFLQMISQKEDKKYDDKGKLYTFECCHRSRNAAVANHCYDDLMNLWGYPSNSRSFHGIELLPSSGVPWQVHTHGTYQPGQYIYHCKPSSHCGSTITDTHYFHFDIHNYMQTPRHNMMIKKAGLRENAVFLFFRRAITTRKELKAIAVSGDHRKHVYHIRLLPNLDTVSAMRVLLNLGGVVEVAPIYFDHCMEGPAMPPYDLDA
jgi:hypothetical protein